MRLSDEHLTAVARRRRIINHYDPDLGGFDPSSQQARPWVAGLLAFADVDNHQVDTVAWDIVGALALYQSEVVPTYPRMAAWAALGNNLISTLVDESRRRHLECHLSPDTLPPVFTQTSPVVFG